MLEAASLARGDPPIATLSSLHLPRATIHRLRTYHDFESAAPAWEALERVAPAAPYQMRAWLWPWAATLGGASGITPAIIVAYDEAGLPLALLPFGFRRRGALTIGGFLGGRDSNFNLGLFHPDYSWDAATISDMLRRGGRASQPPIDVFILGNQPLSWEGRPNPLALLAHQPSPSFGYKARLRADPEDFMRAALSREARRKLRQKMKGLTEIGPVVHRCAATPEERRAALDAYEAQRRARCLALGLAPGNMPALRRFLEEVSTSRPTQRGVPSAAVEIHMLLCGTRILATFLAATHRNRCCGMLISFSADPDVVKMSPGDILLAGVIEDQCRRGRAVFDLGVGEARYKHGYCPEIEPLFDSTLALSARGALFACIERWRLRAKRLIKQSGPLWRLVHKLRKTRGRWFMGKV